MQNTCTSPRRTSIPLRRAVPSDGARDGSDHVYGMIFSRTQVQAVALLIVAVRAQLPRCDNTCMFSNDNDCDDSSLGSEYAMCHAGTDCIDCGPRPALPPSCSQSTCDGLGVHGQPCLGGSAFEPCRCRQGRARETGETVHIDGTTFYEYSCCTEGGSGEECGDYIGHWFGWAVFGVIVVVAAICIACCCYCCRGCCEACGMECCCLAAPPAQPGWPRVPAQSGLAVPSASSSTAAGMPVPLAVGAPMQSVPAIVPAGVSPGQAFVVVTPDGGHVQVIAPPGSFPGSQFHIQVPMAMSVPVQAVPVVSGAVPVAHAYAVRGHESVSV